MPKKKPKPRKTPSQRRRHQGAPDRHAAPVAVPALLAELEEWARELDLFIEDSTWLVERAIDLKREQLGSPDPTAWTEQEIRHVLTEAFPRRVATSADDARLLVPAMTLFFSFLLSTGRFRSALSDAGLTALMEELAGEVPRALQDPARRSMGGNVLEYATELGVDVADPAQLAAFLERFNNLPYEERVAITDGTVFDEPGKHVWAWPATLGHEPDACALSTGPFDADAAAAWFARSPLWRRARALLGWVGESRQLTSTGALRRADTAEVVSLLGIEGNPSPTSMWKVGELVLLWVALVRLGYLEVGDKHVTPGEEALPEPDAAGISAAAASLHAAVLHAFLERGAEEYRATVPDLAVGALMRAAEPAGLTAVSPGLDTRPWGADELGTRFIASDLAKLASLGVVEREGDTYRLPEMLHPIVPAAVAMLDAG
ncbi:hypothetical protein [Georgenia ruanii]|uniref:hypothetical protein n=1 Tax=Georgenia ruanii TaxID=348442 RepID=UPI00126413B4|nr:hypothetical protein [Georgenia ruanii]